MEENTSKVFVGVATPLNPTPGAGTALFVINLCASIAPVDTKGRNLPGLENYRLYQVARIEDGRTRHRLRLGFFTSEAHAESVLAVVRQQYPTAFTTCLCDEDRRYARGYLPPSAPPAPAPARPVAVAARPPASAAAAPNKNPPPVAKATPAGAAAKPVPSPTQPKPALTPAKPAAPKPPARQGVLDAGWKPAAKAQPATAAPTVAIATKWKPPGLRSTADDSASTAKHPVLTPVHKAQPVSKAAAPNTPPAPKAPAAETASSMRVKALNLTCSDPPAPPVRGKPAAKPNEPFHVGRGVNIGELPISLQAEPPKTQPQNAAPQGQGRANTATARTSPAAKVVAKHQSELPSAIAAKVGAPAPHSRLPDLDSTQTIRALTSAELNDDTQEKWFAIQLAASEQPVNLDTMPHLDIFEAYRLYSVATAGSGKIVHSLRLGFFKEAVSAEAVAGYLKTFFSAPTVQRISVAEHARFKDAPTQKKAPADEQQATAKVIELSDARAARPAVPTVTMEVPAPTDAAGSFKVNATGTFKLNASGSHKMLTPTLKPAVKSAGVVTKRSAPVSRKTGATGAYKALPKKSLSEQLLDEAREVELSESGSRKLPKNNSLLSKLVDKLTK